MAIILGLDVSTSCTGICVVDSDVEPDDKGSHILVLEAIQFKGCKTLWDKADRVNHALEDLAYTLIKRKALHGLEDDSNHNPESVWNYRPGQEFIERVVVEEPLMGFRAGMSSAQTITQLMKFNGVVSYIAREVFKREPEYISAAHARKLCGVKLKKTAVAGPQKLQVFEHMMQYDLNHVTWPLKKSGKRVDWATDACDAYVIARAASCQ